MSTRDEEAARIFLSMNAQDALFDVFFDAESVLSWVLRHRPEMRETLEILVDDEELDADLGALAGEPVDHCASVVVTVKCLVDDEDLDEDDVDEEGYDTIGGVYSYLVQSDSPVSADIFREAALDEFHDTHAIATLDNYEITAVVGGEIPEDAVRGGGVWVDAPEYGFKGSEQDAEASGPLCDM